jgi:DNA invertase Pin-like site-specific DNA recombinase
MNQGRKINMTNVYGYARVSTVQQDLELQIGALVKAGVPEENVFKEKYSGKTIEDRKQLNLLLDTVKAGDTIFVHKLDRLGRSVSQVTSLVDQLTKDGVFLVVLDAGIDTRKNGAGIEGLMTKALITLLGLMAEMERTFILERTKPAIEQAKKNGVKFGAKAKHTKEYAMAVDLYLQGGLTVPEVLSKFSVCQEATFYRRLKARKKELGIL